MGLDDAARVFVQDAERSRWRFRSTGVHSFADLGFDDDLGFMGEQQPHGTHGHAVWDRRFGKSLARVLFEGLGVSAPCSAFHVLLKTVLHVHVKMTAKL